MPVWTWIVVVAVEKKTSDTGPLIRHGFLPFGIASCEFSLIPPSLFFEGTSPIFFFLGGGGMMCVRSSVQTIASQIHAEKKKRV